jgi:hypothetical protein
MVAAFVRENEFMGRGEASFDLDELAEFAGQLDAFSHDSRGVVGIAGGHWEGGRLETILLSLQVSAVDPLGHVVLRVEAAEPFSPGNRALGEQRVVAFLATEPEALGGFAKRLVAATQGGAAAVELA